jgi:hypothetical protein
MCFHRPSVLSHENKRRATGKMPVLLLFSSLVVACGAMAVRRNPDVSVWGRIVESRDPISDSCSVRYAPDSTTQYSELCGSLAILQVLGSSDR